ncbi:MAG: histidine kinase [Bacteroidota bacterium]
MASLLVTFILFLILTPLLPVAAQVIQPLSFNYTVDDGLPSSECYDVLQDQQGYIWISTDNGITRYDGHKFEHFGEAQGLQDKTIFSLQEDHRGWIWMNSMKGNFYIYRGDTIAAFPYNHAFQQIREEFDLIHEFIVDEQGTLHASLEGYAIVTVNDRGHVSKAMDLSGRHRFQNGVYCLGEEVLRVSKINADLDSYNGFTLDVYQNWAPQKTQVIEVPQELTGDLTRISGKDYVSVFNIGKYYLVQRRNYVLFFDQDFNLAHHRTFSYGAINSFEILDNGNILLGLHEKRGMLWFDDLEQLQYGAPSKQLFYKRSISQIKQDRSGGIWATCTENGIYYIPHPEYRSLVDLGNTGDYGSLLSLNDELWISTRSGRLLQVGADETVREILNNDQLYEILGLGYVSARNQVVAYNPVAFLNGNNWENAAQNHANGKRYNTVLINGILKGTDPDSTLFFLRTGALYKLSSKPPFILKLHTDVSEAIKNKVVLCGLQLKPNTYWFGTRSGTVLTELDKYGNTVHSDTAFTKLQINDLALLPDQSLLIATKGGGLLRYFDKTGTTESILDQLIVTQVKIDQTGTIWAVTNNGLYKIATQNELVIEGTFSSLTGLPSNTINDLTFWQNQCWISTPKQIIGIPLDFHKSKPSTQVKTKTVTLNGQEMPVEELRNIPHNHELRLVLTAQNYVANQKNRYRYRLNPKNHWIETNNPELNFVDLTPGNYQLEIQTLQNSASWSASTSILLGVTPPLHKRLWFIFLVLTAGLLIIYLIFRQRIRNLSRQKENLALQEEIGQLKQQAYRAQMNPHFIFNCLGTIQGMIIGEEADKDKAVRLIASFSQLIRYALESSRRDQVVLKDEINLLKRYLQLEQQRFSNRFDFHFSIDPSIDLDWQTIPPMLVQPYVENAVLHGMEHKDGDGKITITYQQLAEQLKITIEDNGPGISYTKALKAASKSKFKHRSAGMTITQKRLELLSSPACSVRIFEPKNEMGTVIGTTVELTL